MASEEELTPKIEELEKKKSELIDRIKQLNRMIRYKEYELKALIPYLDQHKDVDTIGPKKQKRAIEFKISTAAYTPKMEKDLIKELKKVEESISSVREVEKARRKQKYVEKDLLDGKNEIVQIEQELKTIRESLKSYYGQLKTIKGPIRRPVDQKRDEEEDMVALGDLALIEKE